MKVTDIKILKSLSIKQVIDVIQDNVDRYMNNNIDMPTDSKNAAIRIHSPTKSRAILTKYKICYI